MAFEFCCPNAPVDTPGLLPDTNAATCGVCRLMPGFPGASGSPTATELSDEHSLAGTLGSLIAEAGAATTTNDTLPANKPPTISLRQMRRRFGTALATAPCDQLVSRRSGCISFS